MLSKSKQPQYEREAFFPFLGAGRRPGARRSRARGAGPEHARTVPNCYLTGTGTGTGTGCATLPPLHVTCALCSAPLAAGVYCTSPTSKQMRRKRSTALHTPPWALARLAARGCAAYYKARASSCRPERRACCLPCLAFACQSNPVLHLLGRLVAGQSSGASFDSSAVAGCLSSQLARRLVAPPGREGVCVCLADRDRIREIEREAMDDAERSQAPPESCVDWRGRPCRPRHGGMRAAAFVLGACVRFRCLSGSPFLPGDGLLLLLCS